MRGPRSLFTLLREERRLFDLLWYQRYRLDFMDGSEPHFAVAERAARRIEKRRNKGKSIPILDDFEYGMLSGRIAAIRWALGDEYTNLDF